MIAGIRPESFEDASLVGDLRDQGHVLKAKIDLIESMGSELYVYFEIETEGVDSRELEELAADSGAAEVPGAGTGQVVARLSPRARSSAGRRPSSGSTPGRCTCSTRRAASDSGPSRAAYSGGGGSPYSGSPVGR